MHRCFSRSLAVLWTPCVNPANDAAVRSVVGYVIQNDCVFFTAAAGGCKGKALEILQVCEI